MARIIEPFKQFFDGEGEPLSNGWLKFTESGTNLTDRDTYADVTLQIPNTNPLQLDSEGRCPNVFGTGNYRITLFAYDPSDPYTPGVQIDQKDPVGPTVAGTTTFEIWDNEEIYESGAIVIGSDDNYYRSIGGSNEGNDPTTTPSKWERIDYSHFYNAGISYDIYDRVIDANTGYVYISLADGNLNNTPSSSPTFWKDRIALSDADIATNASGIATNASGIATNVTNIATNAGNIATNVTNISTNASDIQTVDDKYLPDNVEKLLLNDTSATPGDAYVGKEYAGNMYFGFQAPGSQRYGQSAVGSQRYGQSATGDQYYGLQAFGAQLYGQGSTGAMEIGSTAGSHTDKKLISLTKEATFEAIIDSTNQATETAQGIIELATVAEAEAGTDTERAITPATLASTLDAVLWGDWVLLGPGANFIAYTQDLKYRVSVDGKNIQFHGNLQSSTIAAGAWAYGVFADLPVSVRPSNYRYATSINITNGEVYAIIIESDGRSRIYPPAGGLTSQFVGFDFIINLDQ